MNLQWWLFICFLHILLINRASSHVDSSLILPKYDTNYVGKYRHKVNLSLLTLTRGLNVKLYNRDNSRQFLEYAPNDLANFGFGFCYKWLSLEAAFRSPFDKLNPTKGETDQFSLRANVIRQKFWSSLIIANYQGFYLSNTDVVDKQWFEKNKNYPLRPDMRTRTFYIVTNYVFNHKKFSVMASVNNFERQIKSAGSFIMGGAFTQYGFDGDSSFVPLKVKENFSEKSTVKGINTKFIAVNIGYMYTLVIKKRYFAHVALIPSIGLKTTRYFYQTPQISQDDNSIGAAADTRFSLGYNSERAFGGIGVQSIALNSNSNGKKVVDYGYLSVKLFYGRRISIGKKSKTKSR